MVRRCYMHTLKGALQATVESGITHHALTVSLPLRRRQQQIGQTTPSSHPKWWNSNMRNLGPSICRQADSAAGDIEVLREKTHE